MIRDLVIGMLACAGLFALFAWLRPMRGCSGQCGGCASDCALKHLENP